MWRRYCNREYMIKWEKNLYVMTIIAVILVSGCLNESKYASKDDFKITIQAVQQLSSH